MQSTARANTLETFRLVIDPTVQSIFIDLREQNQDLFAKLMTDQDLAPLVTRSLSRDVYDRILGAGDGS